MSDNLYAQSNYNECKCYNALYRENNPIECGGEEDTKETNPLTIIYYIVISIVGGVIIWQSVILGVSLKVNKNKWLLVLYVVLTIVVILIAIISINWIFRWIQQFLDLILFLR